ncbi:MAG: type IV pilus modification PilV family protein [Candidatus Polarisedimenticolia bacterium]
MAAGVVTRGRQGGFTLVEVLLALFLMGIALLAAAPMFVHAMKQNATGADLGTVGAAAAERMELLRSGDFDALPAGGSLTIDVPGYLDASDPAVVVRWQIVDNGAPATLKTVSVRAVAVRQVIGLRKEIVLSTLRAR